MVKFLDGFGVLFDVCWNWFEIDCVDIVYPISIENPDGDIIYLNSYLSSTEYCRLLNLNFATRLTTQK